MKEKLYDLKQKHLKKHISQTQFIAYGFFLIIMTGTLLLMLPVSSRDGQVEPFLNCLFTATSATCVTGLVVAVFECAIEYQTGRGSVKDTAINAIKGFMAVGLFSSVPVELYRLAITLQVQVSAAISGQGVGVPELAAGIMDNLSSAGALKDADLSALYGGLDPAGNGVFTIFIIIMMGYAIIKVFFANLKRGGILLTQITVGSLYMFSVPRGYVDGFMNWCKQVIGLCLTAFLQATLLTAGLLVIREHALLGLGIMLASGEVPRIAGQFGMDTSTRANLMGSVYAAQSAINLTRTVVTLIPK